MEAQLRGLHAAFEVGVADVQKKDLLLEVEHAADALVQEVLHLAVHLPKPLCTLVERVLGHLPALYLEHLQQRGVTLQVTHRLQLRERVDCAGNNLHQCKVDLLAAPAPGTEELPDLQQAERRAAHSLRTDGARLLLYKA